MPYPSVRNLSVSFDADSTQHRHRVVASRSFANVRNLRSIRRYITSRAPIVSDVTGSDAALIL